MSLPQWTPSRLPLPPHYGGRKRVAPFIHANLPPVFNKMKDNDDEETGERGEGESDGERRDMEEVYADENDDEETGERGEGESGDESDEERSNVQEESDDDENGDEEREERERELGDDEETGDEELSGVEVEETEGDVARITGGQSTGVFELHKLTVVVQKANWLEEEFPDVDFYS